MTDVVVVALMGAGLRLERPMGWKRWATSWRLLGIAMPLTIVTLALIGSWILGLGVASARLLGATLSPADPVLACDVQVGPPIDRRGRRGPFCVDLRCRAERRLELSVRPTCHRLGARREGGCFSTGNFWMCSGDWPQAAFIGCLSNWPTLVTMSSSTGMRCPPDGRIAK